MEGRDLIKTDIESKIGENKQRNKWAEIVHAARPEDPAQVTLSQIFFLFPCWSFLLPMPTSAGVKPSTDATEIG